MLSKGLSQKSRMKTDFTAIEMAEHSQLPENQNHEETAYGKSAQQLFSFFPLGSQESKLGKHTRLPGPSTGRSLSESFFHIQLKPFSQWLLNLARGGGCGRCLWRTHLLVLPCPVSRALLCDRVTFTCEGSGGEARAAPAARHGRFITMPSVMFGNPSSWIFRDYH